MYRFAPLRTLSLHASHVHPCTNDAPTYEESRFHRRAKNVGRGHSATQNLLSWAGSARKRPCTQGSQAQTWRKTIDSAGRGAQTSSNKRKRGEGRGGGVE